MLSPMTFILYIPSAVQYKKNVYQTFEEQGAYQYIFQEFILY